MTPDLSLIATEDLLLELRSRFDTACFVGAKDNYKGHGPEITLSYTGDPNRVGALCVDAAIRISPEVRKMLE